MSKYIHTLLRKGDCFVNVMSCAKRYVRSITKFRQDCLCRASTSGDEKSHSGHDERAELGDLSKETAL